MPDIYIGNIGLQLIVIRVGEIEHQTRTVVTHNTSLDSFLDARINIESVLNNLVQYTAADAEKRE